MLRKYAYSNIGVSAILTETKTDHNLTCTATISTKGVVELLRFTTTGGTTNEYFEDYFQNLLN